MTSRTLVDFPPELPGSGQELEKRRARGAKTIRGGEQRLHACRGSAAHPGAAAIRPAWMTGRETAETTRIAGAGKPSERGRASPLSRRDRHGSSVPAFLRTTRR